VSYSVITVFATFEIFNNPIQQIIREQWNSDLLENFTLKSYENPNLDKVVEANDNFVAGKFKITEITLEKDFANSFSMSFGLGKMDANEIDHPYYKEDTVLARVKLVPETFYYSGITFPAQGDNPDQGNVSEPSIWWNG
jgi:hypothetical protein